MYSPREEGSYAYIFNGAESIFPIPRLVPLRRVPGRYSSLLPLHVILRYQCIVIGKSRGAITVAFKDHENLAIMPLIASLTGCQVFPVIIDPLLMRLLLLRLERAEGKKSWRRYRYADQVQVVQGCVQPSLKTMMQFLTSSSKKLHH